jgi:hypothetical protein
VAHSWPNVDASAVRDDEMPSAAPVEFCLSRSGATTSGSLGLDLGDRFEAFRVGSGAFKERVWQAEKPPKLQGKHGNKRPCEMIKPEAESSMVRRRSPVRVRERA